jgi:hypothetical protein
MVLEAVMLNRILALCALAVLPGCGGGSSSPTPISTPPPQPREGRVELDGAIGGRLVLASSPVRLRDGSFFGCGEARVTIPFRETAGGRATGADYEVKILDLGGFASRLNGKATNIVVNANERGTITITDPYACPEWNGALPPRAEVAMNFAGPAGTVSQVRGVGPLEVVE